jgi:predicted acyl esterase
MRYVIPRIRGLLRPPITVYQPPADLVDDRDLPVPTRDGTTLRANIFRRPGDARRPVILSIHPYGKDNLPRGGDDGPTRFSTAFSGSPNPSASHR